MILKPVAVGEQRLQTRLRAELRHKLRSAVDGRSRPEDRARIRAGDATGELGKLLAHGLKTLYPLKKIEIRSSVVLGTIADEVPGRGVAHNGTRSTGRGGGGHRRACGSRAPPRDRRGNGLLIGWSRGSIA